MKKHLLFVIFISLFVTAIAQKQQSAGFTYAITHQEKENFGVHMLRKINLSNGESESFVFNGVNKQTVLFNAQTNQRISFIADPKIPYDQTLPFITGVAGIAFDKFHNRIYFVPMMVNKLRYIELSTQKIFEVSSASFAKELSYTSEEQVITRMAFNENGIGYALSNDGNTFFRFTTGKKGTVENLGPLFDAESNKGVSIHNRCSSFGGDMVADNDGHLFVVTAANNLFKVEIATRKATLLGPIQNLPAGFTSNGMVVNEEGALVVSSATFGNKWYTVDLSTLGATEMQSTNIMYRCADMANSNVLQTRKASVTMGLRDQVSFLSKIAAYPNPVVDHQFNISFSELTEGAYTIQLTNIAGQQIMNKKISITQTGQIENIQLSQVIRKGMYLLNVYNMADQKIHTQKIMIQ